MISNPNRKVRNVLKTALAIGAILLACSVRPLAAGRSPAGLPPPNGFQAHRALFEANAGQLPRNVNFAVRGRQGSLLLTADGPLWTSANDPLLRMRFAGGRLDAPAALEPQSAYANYFRGKDPGGWQSRVPMYGRIAYHDVYPGIDVVFYGSGSDLEYDFVVRPGGRVSDIVLAFSGAKQVHVDAAGDLVLSTSAGELRQRRPVTWQVIDGVRREAGGRFTIDRHRRVHVAVPDYDRARPLVIDPILVYSTFLGGTNYDRAGDISVDAAGNVYVSGATYSDDFPVQSPLVGRASGYDCFLTKFAPGGALVYSTYYGGTGTEWGWHDGRLGCRIAVASGGDVYLAGTTESSDLPLVAAIQTTSGGATSGFVAKFAADGTHLVFSTYFGGSGDSQLNAIAITSDGSLIAAGSVADPAFPYTTTIIGDGGVLARITAAGSLAWVTRLFRGTRAIALDAGGAIYLTGAVRAANDPTDSFGSLFFATPGAFQTTPNNGSAREFRFTNLPCLDAFVAKVSADGRSLVYSTYLRETNAELNGNAQDVGAAIAVDATGSAYVTGFTGSASFPVTSGAFDTACGPSGACPVRLVSHLYYALEGDVFVTRVNPSGTGLIYSTFAGGTLTQNGSGIAVDAQGRAWISGYTYSSDYPTTADALQPTTPFMSGGTYTDGFLSALSSDGSHLDYSTFVGGDTSDEVTALALAASGDVYVTGTTGANNFPTRRAWQSAHAPGGFDDGFVARIAITPARVLIDAPSSGASVAEPFDITGWAVDLAAASGAGMDGIHVWAYPNPGSGAPPVFVGTAPVGAARVDAAVEFGPEFMNSGFSATVRGLAAGTYDFAVFGHSAVTNTFSALKVVRATLVSDPRLWLDQPTENAAVTDGFMISGWAFDAAASSGTGVDTVHVWAYPNPGSGAAPVFLGVAGYGSSRPDVGAAFGARFTNTGFSVRAEGLGTGRHLLATFAHSMVTDSFSIVRTALVTVNQPVHVWVDTPSSGATVSAPFRISGWALDLTATADGGVDVVHVWAYPNPGSGEPPIFVGAAPCDALRGDVGNAFGRQYDRAGWELPAASLPAGTYDMVAFPHRSITGHFTPPFVVRITVGG
jgi:hypothetical protein